LFKHKQGKELAERIIMETERGLSRMRALFGFGWMLLSWVPLFLWLMALTEGWGAPWDTAPIRSPVGHWQRTLNDFFESGIGAYLPTMIFFCTNFLLYSHKVRTEEIHIVSWAFAITNLMALVALFIVVEIPLAFIPDAPAHLTPDDWAYWGYFRREWPVSLTALLWFIGVVVWQPKLVDMVSERIKRAG